MSTVLAGHGLDKKYGSTTAPAGVDVEIGERDSVAVMGPSGSGKSTLPHTLAGIVRPDEGQVLHQLDQLAGVSFNTSGAIRPALCLAVGALAMFAALGAGRPLLRKVTADARRTAD